MTYMSHVSYDDIRESCVESCVESCFHLSHTHTHYIHTRVYLILNPSFSVLCVLNTDIFEYTVQIVM
jgi:hypothetical protein